MDISQFLQNYIGIILHISIIIKGKIVLLKNALRKEKGLFIFWSLYLLNRYLYYLFFHIMKTASHHQNYVNSRHISFRDRYVTISMSVTQFLYVKYKQTILQEKKTRYRKSYFFQSDVNWSCIMNTGLPIWAYCILGQQLKSFPILT